MKGDVIATGISGGIGPVKPGDTLEIAIEGIGSLVNTVSPELLSDRRCQKTSTPSSDHRLPNDQSLLLDHPYS